MKNKFLFGLLLLALGFVACDSDDDDDHGDDFEYHAHIHSPNSDNKHVDDELNIRVNFESHTGETIHHINVRIYNKADDTEVYNMPSNAHIHETDGEYEFSDTFVLSNANGVTGHTDWILEAKVWAMGAGEAENVETVEFHVHP